MRGRDVNKVARGEQAPCPPQQSPSVSRPLPPSSTPKVGAKTNKLEKESASNQMWRCYDSYYEYHKRIEEKGMEARECKKVAERYKSMCPEWIERWRIESESLGETMNVKACMR